MLSLCQKSPPPPYAGYGHKSNATRWYLKAVAVGLLWLLPWLNAQAWQAELADAVEARDQGRHYAAVQQLETLRDAHPEVGRIRLELAVVYLALDRFDEATAAVDSVLAEVDLPEAVRVNAMLLQRSIERQQARLEQPEIRLTLGADAGVDPSLMAVVGSRATLYRRQYLGQVNVADRPLRQFWQAGLSARQSWYPEPDFSTYQVHPEAGLINQTSRLEFMVLGGYRFTEQDSGPSLRARLAFSLNDALSGHSEWFSVWDDAAAERSLRLGTRWRWTDRWSLNTDWRYRRWQRVSDETAATSYQDISVAVTYTRGYEVTTGVRMPIGAADDTELIMTLNVPLTTNRWSLDNRLVLPVSSVQDSAVLDSLSWRTGVTWDL